MALARSFIDPRYFGPQLAQYLAKGGASGGMGGGSPSQVTGAQKGMQIDPAAALSLWKMMGGGGSTPLADNSAAILGGWESPASIAELEDAGNFLSGFTY